MIIQSEADIALESIFLQHTLTEVLFLWLLRFKVNILVNIEILGEIV